MNKDKQILRSLACRYFEIINSDTNRDNIKLHKCVNDLKPVRPIVLIDEIPWHEMNINGELDCKCEDEHCKNIEWLFRMLIFKWEHMPADMVFAPYFPVRKHINLSDSGYNTMPEEHDSNAQAYRFIDQFTCEDDLEKIKFQTVTYDSDATWQDYNFIGDLFGDILPLKLVGEATGYGMGCAPWDTIVWLRGLDNLFTDLIEKSEFMHKMVKRLTDVFIDKVRQYDEQGLFDGDAYYLHSTSALTDDLKPDYTHVRAKDVWGRGLAQIFASVSPQMHDEFDIQYMIKAMEHFGLVYYGCCEPLDKKIHIVEKIPNLRKISITPWANIEAAAEIMQNRYVVSAKPNPASLAENTLNSGNVRKELEHIVNTCAKNNSPCEIVLKDITTVGGNPQNLFDWVKIAKEVIGGK